MTLIGGSMSLADKSSMAWLPDSLRDSHLWVADGVTCTPDFERSKVINHMVRSIF